MLGTGRAAAARDQARLETSVTADGDSLYMIDDCETPRAAAGLEALRAPAEGAQYRGAIVIEWPRAAPHGVGAIIGRMVSVYDAFTGSEPGPKPISTVSEIALRVSVDEIVTADLTMFADEAGNPILDGEPVPDGDGFRTGVFPFLVSEMRVRHADGVR